MHTDYICPLHEKHSEHYIIYHKAFSTLYNHILTKRKRKKNEKESLGIKYSFSKLDPTKTT